MANMIDYLVWRGEFPFDVTPWNAVDGILVATLSYLNFHGLQDPRGWTLQEARRADVLQTSPDASFPLRRDAFFGMADSNRFGECRMHHFISMTDKEISMQFSAMCLDLPDGTTCIAYRGTDNTLIGWREDFNMSYQTRVPGQEAAGYYLQRAAELSDRPLRLIGHSKGGNLAVYAAACASPAVQDRIESIWNYDGPGMNREVALSEGYGRIREKIHSFLPQTSIIGLLMEYSKPYTVVRSTASGINQHDPMTWQVYGPKFEEMESIDRTAQVISETLHEWLENSRPEQRALFVETMFDLADATKATKMSEITGAKVRSLLKMVGGRRELDPEERRVFNRLMAQVVSLGLGNAMDRVRRRPENDIASGEWSTLPPEEELKAEVQDPAERMTEEEIPDQSESGQ